MARLLANMAFDTSISAAMAQQITKAAEQLAYRQLCILRLATVKADSNLLETNYRDQGKFSRGLYQVLHECRALFTQEYLSTLTARFLASQISYLAY